jgi:hypothetical protein
VLLATRIIAYLAKYFQKSSVSDGFATIGTESRVSQKMRKILRGVEADEKYYKVLYWLKTPHLASIVCLKKNLL